MQIQQTHAARPHNCSQPLKQVTDAVLYFLGGTGYIEITASKGVGEGAKKKDGFNWFAAASRRVCESGPGTVDPVSPGPRGQQMEG